MVQCQNVQFLISLDFSHSLNSVSHERLLNKLRPYVLDPILFRLIKDFLSLRILDSGGHEFSFTNKDCGLLPIGLLTYVLINFFLDDFDREVHHLLPSGFHYLRYITDGVISIPAVGLTSEEILPKLESLLVSLSHSDRIFLFC